MVGGLHASTSYEFQVVAFRGTLGQGADFGSLSNVAGSTSSAPSLSVDVIPTSFTLDVGQARQLQANVLDSYGNTVEGSVTWTTSSSAVATVNSGGSASGVSAGNATLRATYQSSTSGTSAATVVQPSTGGEGGSTGGGTPPPSGGAVPSFAHDIAIGSQPGPNEPSGFTQVDPTAGGNWDVLNDYNGTNLCSPVDGRCFPTPERATDPAFPNNPLLKHTWPTGFGDDALWAGTRGRSGGTRFHLQTPNLHHTESYISVRFKFDPNIQLGPTGLKILGVGSVRANMISAWVLATGFNHRLTFDNKIFCGDFQCTGSPRQIGSSFQFVGNTVYHMEVLTKANSVAGVPDGAVSIWINGTRVLHATDVMFYGDTNQRAGDARWLNGVMIDPIPSARVPAPENWIKYDDLYTSTR
jgi:hypothetical protein